LRQGLQAFPNSPLLTIGLGWSHWLMAGWRIAGIISVHCNITSRSAEADLGHSCLAAALDLAQYEPTFQANDIDEDVLPRLTSEGLKELGSPAHRPAGHRT
jgi:hypothetical protein